MTNDDLADRIMSRIERDQAIHKSSIVEELQLACQRPIVRREVMEKLKDALPGYLEDWDVLNVGGSK